MKHPVTILNEAGDNAPLKASILCGKLLWAGITHQFEMVGSCATVTVQEKDVKTALNA